MYYLIDVMGGKLVKRGFPEADTYHMLMGGAAPAGPFPKAAFDVFAESVDMVPGSFLARGYGNGTVWLVDGGTMRGITSGQAFDQWHFDWQNIVTVPNDMLTKLGPPNPELYISVSSLAVTWNG